MLKPVHGLLTIALSFGALVPTMHGADFHQRNAETVFVMSNNNDKNEVLTYQLGYNGQFDLRARVATAGRGSGGTTDPLQSQGALTLSGDRNLLFAVNAASGTVSSFHLVNDLPILVDVQPSGGAFPVAVAEHNGTVYVLNAGGSGAVEVLKADGLGRLHDVQSSTAFLTGTNSGASSISVSPNGRWLVVIEKASNSIDVFPINPNGTLGTVVNNKSVTAGVFATAFTPNGQLIISENQPNDGSFTSSISSYTINANGTIATVSQSIPTFGNGNCWNVITPNGKWVYAENSATSTIAGFAISSNGTLTPVANTILSALPTGAVNLDVTTSADGKHLFNIQSGVGAIGVYTINSDGTINQLGDIEGLPEMAGFNGIAAL